MAHTHARDASPSTVPTTGESDWRQRSAPRVKIVGVVATSIAAAAASQLPLKCCGGEGPTSDTSGELALMPVAVCKCPDADCRARERDGERGRRLGAAREDMSSGGQNTRHLLVVVNNIRRHVVVRTCACVSSRSPCPACRDRA